MRPTGPRPHLISDQEPLISNARVGLRTTRVRLGGPLNTYSRLRHIEPEVIVGQWLTALLVVVMMLQHYTRFVPFPQCAPAHSADFAGHSYQLQCPRRMGLVGNISRNRPFSNGYRHTADLGHCMKGNQEAEKRWALSLLSANR